MTDPSQLLSQRWASLSTNGILVTQSAAIEDLESAVRENARTRRATAPLVRVGHGLLDEPKAEHLRRALLGAFRAIETTTDDDAPVRTSVTSALEAFNILLPEAGEVDVERALHSEWVRSGRDPHNFPGREPWRPDLVDRQTLGEVLIDLLESPGHVTAETWQRNAGFLSAEELGGVIDRDLHGGTFNEMAHALLPYWTAKWVWAERADAVPLFEHYAWFLDRGLVGLEANDVRIYFADDGRHFKDKPAGNPLPRLSDAYQMLSDPGIQNVGLRSPLEGIRYEPVTSRGRVFDRLQECSAQAAREPTASGRLRLSSPG